MSSPMDWFWCVVLSIIVLRFWWKHSAPSKSKRVPVEPMESDEVNIKTLQRLRDEEELRKQGYSDEVIAVILPTINNQ